MRTKFSLLLLLIFGLFLCQSEISYAHRVNIFAWTASGSIEAECAFSGGSPAQNSPVSVLDTATGQLLATETTDSKGHCAFAITDSMRNAPKGLTLQVNAGSGHLGKWTIEASELNQTQSQPSSEQQTTESSRADAAPSQPAASQPESLTISTEIAALRADIASLHREIASLKNDEPSVRDIVGGLGWIAGLVGVACWFSARRRQS